MSPQRKEFLSAWLKVGHRIFDHLPQIKKAVALVGGFVAALVSKGAYSRFKGSKA